MPGKFPPYDICLERDTILLDKLKRQIFYFVTSGEWLGLSQLDTYMCLRLAQLEMQRGKVERGSGRGVGVEAAKSRLWGCRRNAVCRGGVWDRAGSTGNGFFRNSGSSQCPHWPSALLWCWLSFQLHSGPFPEPASPSFPSDDGSHHVASHYISFTTARAGVFIFFLKHQFSLISIQTIKTDLIYLLFICYLKVYYYDLEPIISKCLRILNCKILLRY